MNFFYLDYNATYLNPFSTPELPQHFYANPSSLHEFGRQARKSLRLINQEILSLFHLEQSDPLASNEFSVIHHSGASEGMNSLFDPFEKLKKFTPPQDCPLIFAHSSTDHQVILEKAKLWQDFSQQPFLLPLEVVSFKVNPRGRIEVESCVRDLLLKSSEGSRIFLNVTWANNETGVAQDLADFVSLKKQLLLSRRFCYLHVDAVQAVGKLNGWQKLLPDVDAYTFSSHKFAGPKSHGFTLIRSSLKKDFYSSLIVGGSQQESMRAGTEHVATYWASLNALKESMDYPWEKIHDFKNELRTLFSTYHCEVVAHDCHEHQPHLMLANTLMVLFPKTPRDVMLAKFDRAGLAVSLGAACSSGGMKPSHVLKAMGYENQQGGIRFSLGPENLKDKAEIIERVKKIIS